MTTRTERFLGEIGAALAALDVDDFARLTERLALAGRIVVHGSGLESHVMRSFAEALRDRGCDAGHAGAVSTPPAGPGDVFLASIAGGDFSEPRGPLRIALAAGAEVVVLTADPEAIAAADIAPHMTFALARGRSSATYRASLFILAEILAEDIGAHLAGTPVPEA